MSFKFDHNDIKPTFTNSPVFNRDLWDGKDSPYELMDKTAHNTAEQFNMLQQIKQDSDRESAINKKRFIIQTVISVAALIASVVAAVAAIIPLI